MWTDNRGVTLAGGQQVAYNISGQLAMGRVISVGTTYRAYGGSKSPRLRVRLLHDAAGQGAGHISTVTNERSVLVVPEGA